MSFVQKIADFFSRPTEETKDKPPEGLCPNCWGRYEYDGKVRKMFRDHQRDVVNGRANDAFIREFVVRELEGIRLQDSPAGYKCPRCLQPVEY